MFPAPFRVVLDANVLFPFSLRDTLLRAASDGLFQLYWSERILKEMSSNLVEESHATQEKADKLVAQMQKAFPEATISGYEPLVAAMQNDPKDRHVVAAAVKAGAQVIVTNNLKDFEELPEGVEAQSPDEFLCSLFDLRPDSLVTLVKAQAEALKNPPRSFEDLLRGLAKLVPEFAKSVRSHAFGM